MCAGRGAGGRVRAAAAVGHVVGLAQGQDGQGPLGRWRVGAGGGLAAPHRPRHAPDAAPAHPRRPGLRGELLRWSGIGAREATLHARWAAPLGACHMRRIRTEDALQEGRQGLGGEAG